MQRTVVVISAGLGVPSSTRMLADQLAAEVRSRVSAAGAEPVIDVIDLRDYATDIANNMVTGYAGPTLAEVIARVEAADAMIAVTPTFSASYSGLFKSFLTFWIRNFLTACLFSSVQLVDPPATPWFLTWLFVRCLVTCVPTPCPPPFMPPQRTGADPALTHSSSESGGGLPSWLPSCSVRSTVPGIPITRPKGRSGR